MAAFSFSKPKGIKKVNDPVLLIVSLILYVILLSTTEMSFLDTFIVVYFIFTMLRFVNNFGNTICFFDFLTFYSALDTLLSPLVSYRYFGRSNHLAFIWGRFMSVSEDVYFGYMIPANLALFLGVHLFFRKNSSDALFYLERARSYVQDKLKVGFVFIGIGFIAGFFESRVPNALNYIFYLISMLTYVGGFYVYFSAKKRRNLVLTMVIALFFVQAAETGLFGEFFMYVILAGCLIMSQYKLKFLPKLAYFMAGILIVVTIQSTKMEYRKLTWLGNKDRSLEYTGQGNLEIFSGLIVDKVLNPENLMSENSLFFLNTRFNQGWLIALTMNYVPRVEPYAYGETIWTSLAAVAVPRFLWPDKPQSGGHQNLSRFVGLKKKITYSMNIGPYGEGYGNFGTLGGILFMFLYGLLLAFFLSKTLQISKKYPSLVIWLPLLFYYVLTVETDILTTINSFVKVALFIYGVYWLARKTYRLNI